MATHTTPARTFLPGCHQNTGTDFYFRNINALQKTTWPEYKKGIPHLKVSLQKPLQNTLKKCCF